MSYVAWSLGDFVPNPGWNSLFSMDLSELLFGGDDICANQQCEKFNFGDLSIEYTFIFVEEKMRISFPSQKWVIFLGMLPSREGVRLFVDFTIYCFFYSYDSFSVPYHFHQIETSATFRVP